MPNVFSFKDLPTKYTDQHAVDNIIKIIIVTELKKSLPIIDNELKKTLFGCSTRLLRKALNVSWKSHTINEDLYVTISSQVGEIDN